MQALPIFAGIILLGLMSISGFQIVPESAVSGGSGSNPARAGQIQVDTTVTNRALSGELFSATVADIDPVITAVTIKQTQDVERNTATLRGRVVVGPETLGRAMFVYGYKQNELERLIVRANSYEELLTDKLVSVQVKSVSRRLSRSTDVSTRVGGLAVDTEYYVRLCVEVVSELLCSNQTTFTTLEGSGSASSVSIPTLRVSDETFTASDELQFSVRVDMRDTEDGRVYAVYGESQSAVSDAIDEEYSDIDEQGDRLQKKRLETNVIGNRTLVESIDDLDDKTRYYFAVCVSYDGRLDGFVCTRVDSVFTPDDDFGDTPRAQTDRVTTSLNSARLAGSVDMHTLNNGRVFFVYGTDENKISELGGKYHMSSIRQNGDRLQRVLVDDDLDRTDSYAVTVRDLLYSTDYVARLCVEYENVDERNRDTMFVECGVVQELSTS